MARPGFIHEVDISGDPGGAWVPYDISQYVRHVEIDRGAPDELSDIAPSTADYVLDNVDAVFDSRNAASPLYPYLNPEGMRIRTYVPRYGSTPSPTTLTLAGSEQTDAFRRDGRPRRFPVMAADCETCGQVTLLNDMTNVQTTIPLSAIDPAWPTKSAFRVMVGQETILVKPDGTLNPVCVRGVAARFGTAQSAAAHSAGDVVSNWFDGWQFGSASTKAYTLGGIPSDQIEIVADPVRKGTRAWLMRVRPGDQNDSTDATRERAELAKTGVGELGETWAYAFSRFLPVGFHANQSDAGSFPGAITTQIGPNYGQGSPALAIRVNQLSSGPAPHLGDNYFRVVYNTGGTSGTFIGTYTNQFDLVYAEEGVWHDFIVEVLWHLTSGTVRIFHRANGGPWRLVHSNSGIATSAAFGGTTPSVQWRNGIYRNASATKTNYLIADEHRAGRSIFDVLVDDPPLTDDSVGIWPAGTNLLPNETWTASGTPTITTPATDSDVPIPGSTVVRVDFAAQNDYVHRTFTGLTIGVVYTATLWVKREDVDAQNVTFAVRNNANNADVGTAALTRFLNGWQRVRVKWTAAETAGRIRIIMTDSVNKPVRIWITAPMLEAAAVPGPYTPVGSPRSASRVQVPSAELSPTAGWIAFRVRIPWGNSTEPGTDSGIRRVWFWGDGSESFSLYYDESANTFRARKTKAGSSVGQASVAYALDDFSSGGIVNNEVTLIVRWDASNIALSVDGSAFTSASASGSPTVAGFSTFDLGRVSTSATAYLCGLFLWSAWGTGTLTDADAAAVHKRYGFGDGRDPFPTDAHWPAAAVVAATWQASDSTYLVVDNGYLYTGFVEKIPQSWPAQGHDAISEVHSEDGLQIMGETPLPTSNPDFFDYADVVGARRPAYFLPLDDPPGTKVAHYLRKKKLLVGDHVYIRKHRARRTVTRSEAEGNAGPAGIYKNTPQLGQLGLVIGDPATSTRFRRSQSEFVLIPLDDADDAPAMDMTLEAWISPDSIATGGGNRNAIIAGPPLSFGTNLNAFMLYISSGGVSAEFPDVLGVNPSPSVAVDWIAGRIYYVAVTVDASLLATVVVGDVTNGTFTVGTPEQLLTAGAAITTPYRMKIAGSDISSHYFDGRIQYPAVYQRGLTLAALEHHFESGAFRGFSQQLPGERIGKALDLVGLWNPGGEPTTQIGLKGLRVDSQLSLANLQTTLDAAQALGAEIIRVSAFWDNIETSDNVYTWTKHDNVVSECKARGLKIVFHIAQTPTWAVPGGGWTPPTTTTQLNQWKSFLQTMAARYGTDVDIYEIWNEPNGATFWNSASAQSVWPSEYAKVLRYAHDGLRAGDPDVKIAAMNTNRAYVSGYMNEVYNALESQVGVPTCQANGYFFDILSVHPYALTHAPTFAAGGDDIADAWGGVIGRSFLDYRRARDLVHTREGVWKDVYMGEFGYNTDGSSNNGPVADATRATYVQMAFDAIRDDGFVIGLTWYAWKQSTSAWDIDGTATGTAFDNVAPSEAAPAEPFPGVRELEAGTRLVQARRQGGQASSEPILEAAAADSGRFWFSPANRPRYVGKGWRERGARAVPQLVLGDAAERAINPDAIPYREAAVDRSRANMVREARVTMSGSEETQIVTSDLYAPGQMKPGIAQDVLVTTDAAALEIAQEYIDRYENSIERAEPVTVVGKVDGDRGWQAFFLDIGDNVLVSRIPKNGPPKAFTGNIEHVRITLDRELDETVELTVSNS